MTQSTGQKTGQAPPVGYSWGDYLEALVAELGTLTAVAWKLAERGAGEDDVASIERALRRLRGRGQRDGGTWGQRLLRTFGVPRALEDRLRFMGLYHSPFNDLSISLCLDQLRLFDHPPASESRARVWLHLGYTSTALRQRDFSEAAACLDRAAEVPSAPEEARIEVALVRAYLHSRVGSDAQVMSELAIAQSLLASATLEAGDHACFHARLVDQLAFRDNRAHDYATALSRYRALPEADTHPFASYRRDAGLAYGYWRSEQKDAALHCARRACEHAGDGGYTRLRVMALLLLARIEGLPAATATLQRAQAIATRLQDCELLSRVQRASRQGAASD